MKKILVFMVDFYQYKEYIKNELKYNGYEVYCYSDSVKLNTYERILSKIFKRYKMKKFDKYFNSTIIKNKNISFDDILIIFGGNYMNEKHVILLKETFKKARVIYYAWDSVKNFPNIEFLLKSADISYTFDPYDSEKYNVGFLPLFYIKNSSNLKKNYDVSIVMSLFNEKIPTIIKLLSLIKNKNFNNFIYLKIRDKFYYQQLKIKSRNKVRILEKYFKFEPLNYEEVIKIISESKIVLDCPLPNQSGLTIRTFETLALNCKLITTNKNIISYDFYTKDNIFIVDENTDRIPEDFFITKFNSDYKLDSKYSIQNFIKKLIS